MTGVADSVCALILLPIVGLGYLGYYVMPIVATGGIVCGAVALVLNHVAELFMEGRYFTATAIIILIFLATAQMTKW